MCPILQSRQPHLLNDRRLSFAYPFPYLEYCFLGFHQPGTRTIPCTTPTPQVGIISTGVAIIEYSKPGGAQFRFQLSVSHAADPTTTFNINLNYQNPVAGMNMGIFLVVIKKQPNGLYVDLINFSKCFQYSLGWPGGTFLDNYNNVYKSDTKQFDVSQDTIFTFGTAGLIAIPFASYWEMIVLGIFLITQVELSIFNGKSYPLLPTLFSTSKSFSPIQTKSRDSQVLSFSLTLHK